ncbi:MAG: flavodoxin [Ruminococcus sp.]
MKKWMGFVFSFLLIFSLAACGNQETESTSSPKSNKAGSGKTLVVYFSATGNTKDVAKYISSATEGDLFELVPKEPYSDEDLDWTDEDSRVVYEHDNPDKRNVPLESATPENFDEYDTVFIGYPIWWGIAAWLVDEFVETNDFTGKTVIPFCTSASSDLGESGELLEKTAGTGNWLEGERFSSGVSESDVIEWLENLDY